jgi:DNA-binding transcriptional LysR family regulator
MAQNLDIALLRTFLAVADRRSMTVAGTALHMTQGAISQQIKRLEEIFANPLFDRDRRGLRLTASGEHLLGKARRLLAEHDTLWRDMSATTMHGVARLGVPFDLVGSIAPLLKRYAEAYPQVDIALSCASSPDLTAAVAKAAIDLAVIEEAWVPGTTGHLAVESLVWVGAQAGHAHRRRPLPVSMVAETCAFRPAVLAALQGDALAWRTMFDNGGLEATLAVVRADLAVSIWLAATVPPDLTILPAEAGLPPLPPFAITLRQLPTETRPHIVELARTIRQALTR